jgi:magnesium transporter
VLINCVAYRNGNRLADLPIGEISDYLARSDCFVWVALCDPTPLELAQMQAEFGLHDLAVEDAHHGHQRPKIEDYGDSLFVVMHQIEVEAGDFSVSEVHVFVGSNYVLSIRNRSQQNFFAVRERCEREPHLLRHGSGFVLYALMDAVVDRYFPIMQKLESELEEIEAHIFDMGAAQTSIRRFYDLKCKVSLLKHAVAPLMEADSKLFGGRGSALCASHREYFRDVYDHLARINSSLDHIRETIGMGIQVNFSMIAIEESQVNKRLAAWAGIFAVATAFAGIWGMNFRAMPELEWAYGYPLALSVIGVACAFLYVRFRRSGWL